MSRTTKLKSERSITENKVLFDYGNLESSNLSFFEKTYVVITWVFFYGGDSSYLNKYMALLSSSFYLFFFLYNIGKKSEEIIWLIEIKFVYLQHRS